ncbi:MAG: TIGR03013 family XrtA/PEP-CTERM system glycosyltransferase [Pseudomonadota bacterium]
MLLWLAESAVVLIASQFACRLVGGPSFNSAIDWTQAAVFGGSVILAMVAMGLFTRRMRDRMAGVILRITLSVVAGGVLSGLILGFWPEYKYTWPELVSSMVCSWLLLVLVRAIAQRLIDEDIFKRRVLVYGAGNNAMRIAKLRRRADQRGFKLLGFIPAEGEAVEVSEDRLVRVDIPLHEYARENAIEEIVVAMDDRRRSFPLKELLECRLAGIVISEQVGFLERETGKVHLELLTPSWIIFGGGFRRNGMRVRSERIFDLLASSGLLLLASPIMLLTALAIKLEDGFSAPVFYGQDRVGFAGRIFRVLKFRSMRVDAERDGKAQWATTNDNRVTFLGKYLRKLRIDELPQLLNVLRGEMSFVGPRPERPQFVDKLADTIPYYRERHSVKPGITGWAQLCYPYGASEQDAVEKLQYDLFYVKNHDLVFDMLILLQTVEVILLGKGAR